MVQTVLNLGKISGCLGGAYEDGCLLGCSLAQLYLKTAIFLKNTDSFGGRFCIFTESEHFSSEAGFCMVALNMS
jgi:hypothetical protein